MGLFDSVKKGAGLVKKGYNTTKAGYDKYQAKRKLERETAGTKAWRRDQLNKAEQEFEFKGELQGRRSRGYQRGLERGRGGGGTMASIGRGIQAFDAAAGELIGDVDLGGIGGGLQGDFSGIGFGGMMDRGHPKQHRRPRPRSRSRSRRRGR